MRPRSDIVQGLLIGIARETARVLEVPASDAQCRHAAWMIANAGFGLSYEEIGAAQTVSKQAVADALARMADRCETRSYERKIVAIAETFGVSL
jgi:hypothetical protein